jgi:hypothetical protein
MLSDELMLSDLLEALQETETRLQHPPSLERASRGQEIAVGGSPERSLVDEVSG